MSRAQEILSTIKPPDKRSPTAKWFDARPDEAKVMIEVIELAAEAKMPRKHAIQAAQAALGGPPRSYKSVEAWYLALKES